MMAQSFSSNYDNTHAVDGVCASSLATLILMRFVSCSDEK